MSYGSAAGVGAQSALWSDNGTFTASTRPTLSTVNTWLEQVSNSIDAALADEGFTTPVTVAKVVSVLDMYTNGIVKDLVDWSHGAGRYYSDRYIKAGLSPFTTVDSEIQKWVQRKSVGFANLGVPRSETGRQEASFDLL